MTVLNIRYYQPRNTAKHTRRMELSCVSLPGKILQAQIGLISHIQKYWEFKNLAMKNMLSKSMSCIN